MHGRVGSGPGLDEAIGRDLEMSLNLGLITACLCGHKDGAELEQGVSLHVLGQLM